MGLPFKCSVLGIPLGATSNFLNFSPNFPYVQYKKSSHKTALLTNAIALFFTLICSNLSTIISFHFILPITSINIYNLQLIYLTVPYNF